MFLEVKCDSTFLNGVGKFDARTAGIVVGSEAYNGDDGAMGAVGWRWGDAKAKNCGVSQLKSPMSTLSNLSYLCTYEQSMRFWVRI